MDVWAKGTGFAALTIGKATENAPFSHAYLIKTDDYWSLTTGSGYLPRRRRLEETSPA